MSGKTIIKIMSIVLLFLILTSIILTIVGEVPMIVKVILGIISIMGIGLGLLDIKEDKVIKFLDKLNKTK